MFLVIVRPQGHDTSITYLKIIHAIEWGIFQWQYLLYLESLAHGCIEIFTNFCTISKEERSLLTKMPSFTCSAVFQKGNT